jgi:hypothetical protein
MYMYLFDSTSICDNADTYTRIHIDWDGVIRIKQLKHKQTTQRMAPTHKSFHNQKSKYSQICL